MAGHTVPISRNMFYVYILKSITDPSQTYKGFTADLSDRINRHNTGQVKHTNKYKPWRLEFYCAFEEKEKALKFEKYLKTASGMAFVRKRLI